MNDYGFNRSYKSIVYYLNTTEPVKFNSTCKSLSEALDKEIGYVRKSFSIMEIQMAPEPQRNWCRGDI